MNREQAVTVIKQIFQYCRYMEGKSLELMPPKGDDALSDTFQIHIQTRDDDLLVSCIKNIAKEHNVAVKIAKGSCIVYKPHPNMSDP
ncbi:MAG: hypothetical protein ACXV2C_03250 [Candidatus Bathyarchaeia archaeon]